MQEEIHPPAVSHTPSEYDPPLVERVMDAAELSREVHYAGLIPIS